MKRVLDFVLSFVLLLVLSPFFLVIAILVKIDSKGRLFFLQERLGKNGAVFKVYKFRTMTDRPRAVTQEILSGNVEVTKVGGFLRRFKLDELPQLINICRGEMSFVGPRPCMPSQINDFNEDGKRRILVTPGLTGLAQVNGNIYLSWEERWQYDSEYVDRLSFFLDVMIVFKTVAIVLLGENKFLKKPNE